MNPIDKKKDSIRLQVFLSHHGISSRRKAMDIIKAGRVKVNGKIILEPSTKVIEGKDEIACDGQLITAKKYDYILLNKSTGYVSTKEVRKSAQNVFKLLPKKYHHLSSVGRLDKNTEGLLLFTNDGDVAYKLTHPKFNVKKVYQVRVKGQLKQRDKARLMHGIIIEGKKTAPAQVNNIKCTKDITEFVMGIHEGRKRQIRLMCDKVGHKVVYLKRIAQGPLNIERIASGAWRKLTQKEINQIKNIKES